MYYLLARIWMFFCIWKNYNYYKHLIIKIPIIQYSKIRLHIEKR